MRSDDELLSTVCVGRYVRTLDDLPERDRERRISTLLGFARHVDREPDQMVEEIFDEQTRKYRKRGFYTEQARAFAATFDEPPNAQLQRANVIRAFFIANGRRLVPDKPAWMTAPADADEGE